MKSSRKTNYKRVKELKKLLDKYIKSMDDKSPEEIQKEFESLDDSELIIRYKSYLLVNEWLKLIAKSPWKLPYPDLRDAEYSYERQEYSYYEWAEKDEIDKKYIIFKNIAQIAMAKYPDVYLIFIEELKEFEPKLIKKLKKNRIDNLYLDLNAIKKYLIKKPNKNRSGSGCLGVIILILIPIIIFLA